MFFFFHTRTKVGDSGLSQYLFLWNRFTVGLLIDSLFGSSASIKMDTTITAQEIFVYIQRVRDRDRVAKAVRSRAVIDRHLPSLNPVIARLACLDTLALGMGVTWVVFMENSSATPAKWRVDISFV